MAGDIATLTYLFSDLEGSTRLWELHPQGMERALARHDTILRDAVEGAGGEVVKTTGDGLMAVFEAPPAAVDASVRAQRALHEEEWGDTGPLRVRMGVHVGESQPRAGDYYGTAVNRAARIMAAGHGGQVLLSSRAAEVVGGALPPGVTLRDLGTHRLKDLAGPEHLFQLVVAELPDTFPPLATLDVRPNNLPTQTSAFLGREAILEDLRARLDDADVRLVTLVGPGGAGKTRLGLQAAAEQIDRFEDGVFFVDLSAEREPTAVFAAIVRAAALGGTGEEDPLEAAVRGLREAETFLLLDNFEQVTGAAVGLVDLLERCPGVMVLVTSREALRVRGEHLFPVPPLSLPTSAPGEITVEGAFESEAVRLFHERATEIRPDFAVTDANVEDVAAICAAVDGLPLAIELAAARVKLFSVEELRDRLDRRLDELRGGARDLPERQQTLRNTIEWSHELLSEEERRTLWTFSVFVGARLSDVDEVANRVGELRGLDVVELVGALVDKSLVRSTVDAAGRPRFSMLQTVRAYSTEHLEERPELAEAVRRAHAEHYTEKAVDLRRTLSHRDRDEVLDALSGELGNLREAWRYWVGQGDVPRLNELLEPLWGYYDARGQYGAAVELANDLLAVLAIQPETVERVRDEIALEASLARSLIAVRGYTAEVERRVRTALDRLDASGDAPERFPVLRSLATLHMLRSDYAGGIELGRELLAIAERSGDPMLLSDAHLVVGVNTAFGQDLGAGVDHLDRSIEQFSKASPGLVQFRVGPSPGVVAPAVSGLLLWMLGFPERAEARVAKAIEVADRLGHPYSSAYALFHGAVLDLWRGDLRSLGERADALLQISNTNDYAIWRALSFVLRGVVQAASGDAERGLTELERGFTLYHGMSTPPVFWPLLLVIRAVAYGTAGKVDEALDFLAQADAALEHRTSEEADIAIVRGDLLLARQDRPDPAAASAAYDQALGIAKELEARMTRLQAATRLANLHRGTEREADSLAELRDVYGTFTEGFHAPPLVAARAALGIE